jgi:hypothetical protein
MSMTLFATAAIAVANKGERYRTELRVCDLEVRAFSDGILKPRPISCSPWR